MPRNEIIVGLDDSPSGEAALRSAAQYALTAGSQLRAINILDWPYNLSSATPGVDITPLTMDEIDNAYRSSITKSSSRSLRERTGRLNLAEVSRDRYSYESV